MASLRFAKRNGDNTVLNFGEEFKGREENLLPNTNHVIIGCPGLLKF